MHDVETMRIGTPLDSVTELTGYYLCISQTTYIYLIMSWTDANHFEEREVIGKSRIWSEFNGKSIIN